VNFGAAASVPAFLGAREIPVPLATLVDWIDWTPFFAAWEMRGAFPAILDDPRLGQSARSLYDDGRRLLDRIVAEKLLAARAVVGFWPAASVGDDIEVYGTGPAAVPGEAEPLAVVHTLRQQMEKTAGPSQRGPRGLRGAALARVARLPGRVRGHGRDRLRRAGPSFEAAGDDYHAIMSKALADRLAEAAAEWLHAEVRRKLWGYAPNEAAG